MNYQNEYYGEFGGSFIPEILLKNIKELQLNYKIIINSTFFKEKFYQLLKDYVGRPTPLFYCKKLSNYYKSKIFFKREDINYTGAHKINNTIGQALFAKILGKKKLLLKQVLDNMVLLQLRLVHY
jgi:tryptophan synthase beta chain